MDEKFVTDYFINFSKLIQPAKDLILNIIKVKDDLITVSVSGKISKIREKCATLNT